MYLGKVAAASRHAGKGIADRLASFKSPGGVDQSEQDASVGLGNSRGAELDTRVRLLEERIAAGGESAAVDAFSILQRLETTVVDAACLKTSNVGKRVRAFGKHQDPRISQAAKAVVAAWKSQLLRAGT